MLRNPTDDDGDVPKRGGHAGSFVKGRSPDKPRGATRIAKHLQMLDDLNFDCMYEAVKRFRDPKTPSASKDFCLGLITDRCLPKLKAVEITGDKTSAQVLINVIGAQVQRLAEVAAEPVDALPEPDDLLESDVLAIAVPDNSELC